MTGPASLSTSLLIGLAGCAAMRHADESAHRGAEPVHRLDVEPRDQRDHVGDVLRPGIELRVGEPVGVAAPGDVRAHDAELRAQRARQLVEIAPRAGEAVHADQHVAVARVAPLAVGDAVQAGGRGAQHRAPARFYCFSHCATIAVARRFSFLIHGRIAAALRAQQRELLRFQVRAAHRIAVVRVAHALERGLLLVVPDPLVDEAERDLLDRGVGLLRAEQRKRAVAVAKVGVARVGHRVADHRAVGLRLCTSGRARGGPALPPSRRPAPRQLSPRSARRAGRSRSPRGRARRRAPIAPRRAARETRPRRR